jgi:hypothetical protein
MEEESKGSVQDGYDERTGNLLSVINAGMQTQSEHIRKTVN